MRCACASLSSCSPAAAAPALPRQRTLRAALEWSHDLLSEAERKVLRRLAVFPGGFTLEAASAVAGCDEITVDDVVEHVANLVTKSLMVADVGGVAPRYRLLGTTRAYALEKLHESDDAEDVARRHAACCALAGEVTEVGRAGGFWPRGWGRAAVGSMPPVRRPIGSARAKARIRRYSNSSCPVGRRCAHGRGAGSDRARGRASAA